MLAHLYTFQITSFRRDPNKQLQSQIEDELNSFSDREDSDDKFSYHVAGVQGLFYAANLCAPDISLSLDMK